MNTDRITDWPARPTAGPGRLRESPHLLIHPHVVAPNPETRTAARGGFPIPARLTGFRVGKPRPGASRLRESPTLGLH